MNFPDLSITVGSLKITPLFWCLFLTVIFSSFNIWKKYKGEDIPEEEVYKFTLLGVLITVLIFKFNQLIQLPLLLYFWGIVGIDYLWMKKKKRNYWEGFEALSCPLIIFLIFYGVGIFLTSWNYKDLSIVLIGLLALILMKNFQNNYKRFTWYKSGKPGVVFWLVSLLVFLAFIGLAFWQRSSLYLNLIFLSLSIVGIIIIIYKRTERNLKEDFRSIFKKDKK